MTDTQQHRHLPHPVKVVVVLAVVVAAIVIGYKATHQQPTRAAALPAAAPQSAAPVAASGSIGEGVWIVGTDVQPGTYRSSGAVAGRYCMWSRHSSTAGGMIDSIITSDGSNSGQMLVTIQAGDKLFRTRGCAPFTKV